MVAMTWMRKVTLAGIAAAALALAGCGAPTSAEDDLLAQHDLDGLTGQEIVDQLDASDQARPLAFGASVREDAVLISDESTEVAVDLPDDVYYVSIAPWVEGTHECYYHSLATCQGELVDVPVAVTITDDDGTVLVDETATTYANGFVGFWLPRDISGTIEVAYEDYSGAVDFTTTDGSPTCVTTLQLT